jgi:deoxyxylulose-5-phosphate synthase
MENLDELINDNLKLIFDSKNQNLGCDYFVNVDGNNLNTSQQARLRMSLEDKGLVRYNQSVDICTLTEKGYSIVENGGWSTFIKKQKEENEKQINKETLEFDNLKTTTALNKWLLKTKWLPHFISIISILFSIYTYSSSGNETKKLEERIYKLELQLKKNLARAKRTGSE